MRLVGLFSNYKSKLFFILACLIIVAIVSLLLPILNKHLVDDGIIAVNIKSVLTFSLLILLLSSINSLIEIIKDSIMASVSRDVQINLYLTAIKSLLYVESTYFNSRNSAGIYNNIETDVTRISSICDSNVIFVVTQLLSLIGGLIGLIIIDYRLSIIVLIFFPIKAIVTIVLSRHKKIIFEKMLEVHARLSHWFGDRIEGMKDVRLFGIRDHTFNEAKDKISIMTNQERKLIVLDSINGVFDSFLVKLLEAVLYIIGAYFIFDDSLTIGSLFAFITYSMNVMTPLSIVLGINYMLSGVMPSAVRFFSFLDEAEQKKEATGGIYIDRILDIEFDNVSFSYNDRQVLRDINFSIHQGEHVAIVGKNGTGKTTIFNLIQGFIKSDTGDALINGLPISEYNIESYRNCFCCINQNNHLFDMSILDNVALFSEYPGSKMMEVIHLSNLQPVLDACPESVGMDGCHLSGGQRQRVLFARVLFRNKNLILFDEATANLDTESEQMLMGAFSTLFKDKTVVSIIHSAHLLCGMDKIIELDGLGGIRIYNSYEHFMRSRQADWISSDE